MNRLILAGGGHPHLFVLRQFARSKPADLDVTLIDQGLWAVYSGMVPGWMAGQYRREEGGIDLRATRGARRRAFHPAGGREWTRNAAKSRLQTAGDCVTTPSPWMWAAKRTRLRFKPLAGFQDAWPRIVKAAEGNPAYRLVIVGGGAAGVELAMAARTALARVNRAARVVLVAGKAGLLPRVTVDSSGKFTDLGDDPTHESRTGHNAPAPSHA